MNDANRHMLTLFAGLLEAGTPEAQAAYLDQACGGDLDLCTRLEALLRAHRDAGGFLGGKAPTPDPMVTVESPARSETPGMVIGPFKLLQQIGEGGMGTVFMAEQSQPVRRMVALKIIKPGMDSRQVIARFEAERQALALMDHPNIAKVLDAGTTDTGRPYFVMELVKGVPITKFCDERRLTPKQRLELFMPVCQAVQHAHQKGIIHRDLKPSNVLIALYDDKPVPKVIDFGIAKATGQKLTERTMFTEFGQVVGTLEYMSPEQAGLNQLDIDTRSDIYSLGVLLYELLTGTTPLEKKRLLDGAMLEVLRLIREEEPPKPSTRLSATDELASLAANRGLEPKKLSGVVRGELDWLVMKCLEKDRNRRYETANGLASDLQRYLADESVQACPPSATYRLRKFARRNKVVLTAAALVILALAVGTVVSTWQAVRATHALTAERETHAALDAAHGEQDRQRASINRELVTALADVAGLREKAKNSRPSDVGPWNQLREALRRAEALAGGELVDPGLVAQLHALQAALKQEDADRRMAARLEAIRLDVSALKSGYDRVDARVKFPLCEAAFRDYGIPLFELDVAEAARRISASAIRDELIAALEDCTYTGGADWDDGTLWDRLLPILRRVQNDPWHRKYYDAVAADDGPALVRLAGQPETLSQQPGVLVVLAWRLNNFQANGAAVNMLRQVQRRYPADLWINMALMAIVNLEDLKTNSPQETRRLREEGLGYLRAAVAAYPQSHGLRQFLGFYLLESWRHNNGPRHHFDEALHIFQEEVLVQPEDGSAHRGLAIALWEKGDQEAAITASRRAVELDPKNFDNYGEPFYRERQSPDEQIAASRKSIEADPEHAPAHYYTLAGLLRAKGDLDGAVAAVRKVIEVAPADYQLGAHLILAEILRQKGDLDEALTVQRKIIELIPKMAAHDLEENYGTLGEILREKGDFDESLAAFRKAIELDPKSFTDYGALGAALLCDKSVPVKDVMAATRKAVEVYPQMPWAHSQFGHTLREKGDLDGAMAAYGKAIELDPKSQMWWASRAAVYEAQGQWDKAAADWSMAIKVEPNDVSSWIQRAAAYRHLGQQDKALADFSWAQELDPSCFDAVRGRCEIYGEMDQWDRAVVVSSRFIEWCPKNPEGWLLRGRAYRHLGQWDKAAGDLSYAFDLNPSNTSALVFLGKVLQHERDDAASDDLAALRKVAEQYPRKPAAHFALGLALSLKGDQEGAIAAYDKAIELVPKEANYRTSRAVAYQNRGQWDKAAADWSIFLELSPKNADALLQRGRAYRQLGQWDKAVTDLSQSFDLDPTNTVALVLLGKALLHEKGDSAAADVAACRKVVERYPQKPVVHFALGMALSQKGDGAGAIASFRKVIDLDPKYTSAYEWLGRTLLNQGTGSKEDLEGAVAAYSKAIGLAPTTDGYWCCRGFAYQRLGQLDKAQADYSKAVELAPGQITALSLRVEIYRQRGQWDKAVADYSTALKIQPQYTAWWLQRGRAYRQLGQWENALADFSKALDLSPNDGACQNDLARLLATCPDPKVRNPQRAVELAHKAVDRSPKSGDFWNTLGMAQYRAGAEQAAIDALTKSVELRRGGDAVDWLFLAMAHQKLGHRDEARKWYDRAVQWLEKNGAVLAKDPLRAEELRRFQAEAEEVLELKK